MDKSKEAKYAKGSILIYSCVIYSLLCKTLTLLAMQMITHHTPQEIQLRK